VAPPPKKSRTARRWIKPFVVVALLLPLANIGWDAFTGGLGANPIEAVQNRLGFWAITLLAVSLVPTPAKELLGVAWLQRLRRVLGVTAFAYALLHFLFYVGVDKFFDWRTISTDLTRRPFIMVGFAALLCLTPLAVTSTDGWVKRLGFKTWRRIHRLAYLAAALAVVHFVWRVKADLRRPLLFAAIFLVLLVVRVPGWVREARRRAGSRPVA
jgi:sulfoxide reductase heme-binding subunit YedZ